MKQQETCIKPNRSLQGANALCTCPSKCYALCHIAALTPQGRHMQCF